MTIRSVLLPFALLIASSAAIAQPKVSPDEQKMAQAVNAAPDAAGKVKAGGDFVKKYPKSALRSDIARNLVDQIHDVPDGTQKVTLAQQFQSAFNDPAEEEMILPVLIVGYSDAKRPDEAFAAGSAYLAQHPDSVGVLVELTIIATDQAKQKDGKFIAQGAQYGAHAVELIEANKKPATMDDAVWKEYRDLLPRIYQSLGVMAMIKGDRAETRARLTKASELDPADAFNYLLLAGAINDEYQESAKRYQAMADSPAKSAELPKILAALDSVIDAYARFIAASDGVERLSSLRQQQMQDLEAYYKYRHNGKADGMQQLIDKYKTAAKPKPKDPFSLPPV
jgi:hypothetical protein